MYDNGNNGNSILSTDSAIKGYDATTTQNKLYSLDRVNANAFDLDLTVDLGAITEISDFYIFGHYHPYTCYVTYGVFVSDDEATLYDKENRVVLFDYYEAAKVNSLIYKFNKSKYSEGQVWKFSGEQKPTGRYIGIRLYDASHNASYPGFASIYELGAYGNSFMTADNAANIESVSNSKLTAVVGEAPGATFTVTDAEGKPADRLLDGSTYTFTTELSNPFGAVGNAYQNLEVSVEGVGQIKVASKEVYVSSGNTKWYDDLAHNVDMNTIADKFVEATMATDGTITVNIKKSIESYYASLQRIDSGRTQYYTDCFREYVTNCYFKIVLTEPKSGVSTSFNVVFRSSS